MILTNGKITLVDNDDFKKLKKYNWKMSNEGYVYRYEYNRMQKKYINLARLIMNAPKRKVVDHINNNKLDNRKCNLRICTQLENSRNRGKNKNNTSGFKGVFRSLSGKKWIAQISISKKGKRVTYSLGGYDDILSSAKAYNEGAKKYHKEFSRLNDI